VTIDFPPPNPRDPWTRLSCYKWLVTRTLARAIARVAPGVAGRVLDVGCGDRRFAGYFTQAGRYIGLDHPATFAGRREHVDVFGTALSLPFRDRAFDAVVSFEVLEHVPDTGAMLGELARLVRPGGTLVLTAPFLWGEHCQPHDYFRFSVYGLRQLLTERGFTVVAQRRANGLWTLLGERLCYALAPVYGRRLTWVHASLSFLILACAWLLERLHPVDTDYTTSVIVARRPLEAT
jgi:SAM-dependent methyltransferase